jgi:hypothetical protein
MPSIPTICGCATLCWGCASRAIRSTTPSTDPCVLQELRLYPFTYVAHSARVVFGQGCLVRPAGGSRRPGRAKGACPVHATPAGSGRTRRRAAGANERRRA